MALFTKFKSIITLGKWKLPKTFGNTLVFRTVYGKVVRLDYVYEEKFRPKLETNNDLNNDEWKDMRQELINSFTYITTNNVDSIIIDTCVHGDNTKAALSYVNFLKNSKYDMNLATVGKYLKLFWSKDTLTDADKTEILNTIDDILKKYPILDPITLQNCICAICLTEKWQDAIKLLEMTSAQEGLTHTAYMYIVIAAFRNGYIELGFKYLYEIFDKYNTNMFKSEVFTAYLDYCNKFSDKDVIEEKLGRMLQFCNKYYIYLNKYVLHDYMKVYNDKLQWTSKSTSLRADGTCRLCYHQLQPNIVTKEEFSQLSSAILKSVIIGGDVYYKSNPQELNKLIKFVNKTKPYNVVIDGLNVSYHAREKSFNALVNQLATVVKYFVDLNQIVLVLGRQHMNYWPKEKMQYIKTNAFFFFADNISHDDPYLLYATLMSGERTRFLSGDFMRQHTCLLDVNARMIFRRWQMSHQYKLITVHQGKAIINEPLSYLPVVEEDVNGWHIPCKDSQGINSQGPLESHALPKEWICLRRKSTL